MARAADTIRQLRERTGPEYYKWLVAMRQSQPKLGSNGHGG